LLLSESCFAAIGGPSTSRRQDRTILTRKVNRFSKHPVPIIANIEKNPELNHACVTKDGSLDLDCVKSHSPPNTSSSVHCAIHDHLEHKSVSHNRPDISIQQSTKSTSKLSKKAAFLSIFLPWLYFVGGALNVPTLPRYVNYAISPDGDSKVSKLGAQVFGNINGIDSFFTFLSVNLIGVLSDLYGRKGFMVFSTIGLGISHLLMSFAHEPSTFYVAACIDGISSCMLSQSQAYISDLQSDSDNKNIGIALSRFQGVAIGLAYMIGIPLGAIISKAYSNRTPLQVSFAVCIVNAILIGLFLPMPPSTTPVALDDGTAQPTANINLTTSTASEKRTKKRIDWKQANPFGAVNMFVRNKRMLLLGFIYFLINFAHSTLNVNWINYLQYQFQWSAQLSGSTLMIVGLFVAILPSYFVPFFGKLAAIKYSLLLHSLIVAFLGKFCSINFFLLLLNRWFVFL
jgi:MFS family permease